MAQVVWTDEARLWLREIFGVFHDALDLVRHIGSKRTPDQINE